jgi:hypothetical protein
MGLVCVAPLILPDLSVTDESLDFEAIDAEKVPNPISGQNLTECQQLPNNKPMQ